MEEAKIIETRDAIDAVREVAGEIQAAATKLNDLSETLDQLGVAVDVKVDNRTGHVLVNTSLSLDEE